MAEFRMPSLGADMDQGTLLEWLVKAGQQVHKGDAIAVVETDKADVEVEVFEDGIIEKLLVEPHTTVPVGAPLAVLSAAGKGAPVTSPAKRKAATVELVGRPAEMPEEPAEEPVPAAVSASGPSVTPAEPPAPRRPAGRARAGSPLPRHRARQRTAGTGRSSPLARRRARELGIDLAAVTGSGPGGAIRVEDVEAAAAVGPTAVPSAESAATEPTESNEPTELTVRPARKRDRAEATRRITGELMSRSKREIPHYYLRTTVDLTRTMAWLTERNATRSVADRLVPAAALLRAVALAAARTPEMNGWYVDGSFRPSDTVHLGVAVALRPSGLLTPAILDAQTKTLDETMAELTDLVTRARTGRLRQSEMSAATITVTSLGDQAVDEIFGVIYPPQVALVGSGRIVERPYAVDGLVGVRPELTVTLSADHRVSDGRTGGRFLTSIAKLLQTPEEL